MTREGQRPHVIFVGPDKTGSTWVYDRARTHPQIATTRSKDLFYFDHFHKRSLEWYQAQFSVDHQTSALLEVGHDYVFSPEALKRISTSFPHATVALGLREPVQRAVSAYRFLRSQGRTDLPIDRAVLEIPELIDHGRYGTLLGSLREFFDPTAIRFFSFDDLINDPQFAVGNIAKWCGVEAGPMSAGIDAKTNPARTARHPGAVRAARAAGHASRALRLGTMTQAAKDSRVVQRLFFERDASQPPALTPSVDAALREIFTPEMQAFDALSGWDLSATWGYASASRTSPVAIPYRN